MRDRSPLRLALASIAACALGAGCAGPDDAVPVRADSRPILGIEEASGVSRFGDRLFIVGDEEAGTYYTYPLEGAESGRVRLDPGRLQRHTLNAGEYALDLEGLDRLNDGRLVIVSERLAALFDENGFVSTYDRSYGEFGGRGLEGVAVHKRPDGISRVALLWEGGYPDADRLPESVRDLVCYHAMRPRVLVHDLPPGVSGFEVKGRHVWTEIELQVPLPPGAEPEAQRFRAPDFVWHEWEVDGENTLGFIVLLSSAYGLKPGKGSIEECPEKSEKGKPRKYCYKWLQRFLLDGSAWGDAFDLETELPAETRTSNYEGMGWFDRGESLVFVYDEKISEKVVDPQEAFVLPLPAGW